MVVAERLVHDLRGRDLVTVASGVKAAHFTGNCMKPWSCIHSSHAGSHLCEALHLRWGEMWSEVATKGLGSSSAAAEGGPYCKNGHYVDQPAVPKP